MTCKHENAEHLLPGDSVHWDGPLVGFVALVEQFRCLDCAAYLTLGPTRDTAAVLVEIRAAELASWCRQLDQADSDGWDRHAEGADPAKRHLAGWLAREIEMGAEDVRVEPNKVDRDIEALTATIQEVRVVLFTAGYCGDGSLPAMVQRALTEARDAGRSEMQDVSLALHAASNAFPPDMEGTIAERVTALQLQLEKAVRGGTSRERDEARTFIAKHWPARGGTLGDMTKIEELRFDVAEAAKEWRVGQFFVADLVEAVDALLAAEATAKETP